MTVSLPENISTGRVEWWAISDVTDGPDVDQKPDVIAPTGSVNFIASTRVLRNATSSPKPVSVLRDPIVGVLDSEGYLCTPNADGSPAYRGVELIATDDPDLNPADWVYTVTYDLLGRNGRELELESHQIYVPAGTTVDLTVVGPVENAAAIGIPAAEALAAQAASAAADASVAASQALAAASAAEAALVDSDAFVADKIEDPASATQAALNAQIAEVRPTLDPRSFGAVGDGVTDDSAAFAAAVAALKAAGGGTIDIPRGCTFQIPGGVTIDAPNISLVHSGGWLRGGSVTVGSPAITRPDYSSTLLSLLYDGQDAYGTRNAIVLSRARGLRIAGTYKNVNAVVYATTATGATGFHNLGMVRLRGINASGMNYLIYTSPDAWDVLSDWSLADVDSNFAAKSTVRMVQGCDGLTWTDSVCFMQNYSASTDPLFSGKEHHLWIDKVNQLSIDSSVKFFEAGKSAVRIDDAQNISIRAQAVWSGQVVESDAIEINGGSPRGVIACDMIEGWTRAAVGINGGDANRLEIGGNFRLNLTHESNKTGKVLSSGNTYRVLVASGVTGEPALRDTTPALDVWDSIKGRTNTTAVDRKSNYGGVTGFNRRSITITAQTAIGLLSDHGGANTYDGLVIVQARSSSLSSAKTAVYILAVSSSGPNCVEISKTGFIAGGAADHPSFTWALVNHELRATPIGSTTGSGWWFDVTCVGAVKIR